MDRCTDTDWRARRRPTGCRLEGPLRGGVGDRVEGTRVHSQLLEPEAYAEPCAAPACARMETQPLRRSVDQRTDLRVPAALPGAPAPSSQESGTKVPAPQEMRPLLSSPQSGDSASLTPGRLSWGAGERQTPTYPPPWPRLSRDPSPHSAGGAPSLSRRAGPSAPPTSRLCRRSCPLRTRRGRGLSRTAPPPSPSPSPSPQPEVPLCRDIFDVTGF